MVVMMLEPASPYLGRPEEAFWKTAVAGVQGTIPKNLYKKKFTISPDDQILTAGSCFAQHIGKQLRARKFSVIDVEPPPLGLAAENHNRFGYSIYSARYGNIYTVRQMLQLVKEAYGKWMPSEIVWRGRNGRYFDALRPGVEPNGLSSPDEVIAFRRDHLQKVVKALALMDVFIFTMGLTESWICSERGTVYPTAPGTIAGCYDPAAYEFKNFTFDEIYADMKELLHILQLQRREKPGLRVLLTVSPVPLTATASGGHVLCATFYSKAVLRAVAGQLCQEYDEVDYFPSFEIICNPWSAKTFYESNMRSVHPDGVAVVMESFFAEHGSAGVPKAITSSPHQETDGARMLHQDPGDVICEEELLSAFARTAK